MHNFPHELVHTTIDHESLRTRHYPKSPDRLTHLRVLDGDGITSVVERIIFIFSASIELDPSGVSRRPTPRAPQGRRVRVWRTKPEHGQICLPISKYLVSPSISTDPIPTEANSLCLVQFTIPH